MAARETLDGATESRPAREAIAFCRENGAATYLDKPGRATCSLSCSTAASAEPGRPGRALV